MLTSGVVWCAAAEAGTAVEAGAAAASVAGEAGGAVATDFLIL